MSDRTTTGPEPELAAERAAADPSSTLSPPQAPVAAEAPETSVAPVGPESPKAAETAEAPEASESPKAAEAPETSVAPVGPESPKAAETAEAPEASETPKAAVAGEASTAEEASEAAQTAEVPVAPEAVEASEAGQASEAPVAPVTPVAPEAGDAAEGTDVVGVASAPSKGRRRLLAGLRWTAAVAVFAAVGAGVAYGITVPERTDIPGLSTEGDGRWTFPRLSQPALPAGAPLAQGPDNDDETHYAPLTGLLLPAPEGAAPDGTLTADKNGAVSVDVFLEEYAPDAREKLKQSLEWDGLRQITGRGWTMPDGTRTHVYLLRFHASGFVDAFKGCDTNAPLNGVSALELDEVWTGVKSTQNAIVPLRFPGSGMAGESELSVYQEAKPVLGEEQTKIGCLQSGDVLGMVVQTRKGEVAPIPFHQTVILQGQLLS
ncbi:hypothetical protein [Streptomyces sp. NPDC006459]|uniref:hypothetical protein n=1 Tax=Streptomyces sp. NPDC006459 TaxID=3154303 RepID=UPI0033A2A45F